MQSGVLPPPALTQCPHIPLFVCGWPLLTPPREWPFIDCCAWKAACITRHSRIRSFRRLLLLSRCRSANVGKLCWCCLFYFHFHHRHDHMEESNTAITSVHSKHIWDAVCRMCSVWRRGDRGGSEFIWAHLIILWCFTNDAFDSTLTAGSNRSSTDTLWECLTLSITIALLLLLSFVLCFWSCTHWSTCALVQAYSRPD